MWVQTSINNGFTNVSDVEKQLLSLIHLSSTKNGLNSTERNECFAELSELKSALSDPVTLSGVNSLLECSFVFGNHSFVVSEEVQLNIWLRNNSPGTIIVDQIQVRKFEILNFT